MGKELHNYYGASSSTFPDREESLDSCQPFTAQSFDRGRLIFAYLWTSSCFLLVMLRTRGRFF